MKNLLLDEIADHPERALGLPGEALTALALKCASVQSAIATALLLDGGAEREAPASDDDTLDADQIAAMLGTERAWIFKNIKKLPFVHRISRKRLAARRGELLAWREARKQA